MEIIPTELDKTSQRSIEGPSASEDTYYANEIAEAEGLP